MSLTESFLLGVVQGLTEFLPVSSSGHLVLLPWLFNWGDPGLVFSVALHLGTLVALVVYFFRDWVDIVRTGLGGKGKAPQAMLWFLLVATIPAALLGWVFASQAETVFRSPLLVAVVLAVGGLLLLVADRFGKQLSNKKFLLGDALFVGVLQALSIIPGVSRSGITIAAARALGFGRREAARISFLLATPIVFGAAVLTFSRITLADITAPFLFGILSAAAFGLLAVHFLLRLVSRTSYAPFVWYRLLLSALVFIVWYLQ